MRRGGGGNNNSGNSGRRGGSPRTQNFESNGPDIKVRGNAQQIVDKYQTLAREAATAGNPVMAENYYQHAEHYHRVLTANGGGDNRQNNRQQEGDGNPNNQGNQNNQQQANQANNEEPPRQPAEGEAVEVKAVTPQAEPVQETVTTSDVSVSVETAEQPNEASSAANGASVVVAESTKTETTPDGAPTADASPSNDVAEIVRKPRRRRTPKAPKPIEIADEPAAAASDAKPAPAPVEEPEEPVKAAS
jgi:hypothetical protein